jgi:2-amino-4-hydroxy-6-hydroxymethyldihydropteridine diphosphokinase
MQQSIDIVFLRGLAIETTIGFFEWERHVKQTVVIDLEFPVDCARAATSDTVADTVDYKSIAKRVIAFVGEAQFHLVETLAHRLATTLIEEFKLEWVKLSWAFALRDAERFEMLAVLAYVSGGSNLRADSNLRRAAKEILRLHPRARFSRCYENVAVGFDGPPFINFVVELPVQCTAQQLKSELERIERLCGRPAQAPKWAPRAMDLDIVLFGDSVQDEPGLRLPRPDLLRWAFMLGPLAELAPELIHPLERESIASLWQRFDRDTHPLTPVALDLNAL